MRSALAKMVSTIAGLSIVLVLLVVRFDESRSRAEDYPAYPKTKTFTYSSCTSVQICTVCPNPYDGTVVYGTKNARPATGYTQGNCSTGYPGASKTCYGTSWSCERLQCKYMSGDDPPVFQYKGNWCNAP